MIIKIKYVVLGHLYLAYHELDKLSYKSLDEQHAVDELLDLICHVQDLDTESGE